MLQVNLQRSLTGEVRVVNIGLIGFAHDLEQSGAKAVHVDWSPPAFTDPKLSDRLARLGG